MNIVKFSIIVTTKNRIANLNLTLDNLEFFRNRFDTEVLIMDDGCQEGTFEYIKYNHPDIKVYRNMTTKGLIFSRNYLMNQAKGLYIISLDDDSHIINDNALEIIESHFINNPQCGVQSFKIFWSETLNPRELELDLENSFRTKSFVGCGHCWRASSWNIICDYPVWFNFYGEENYASFELFKKDIEVHYQPNVLIHHRVDIKARKKDSDYYKRQIKSLRSGWYLFFMFHPIHLIPRLYLSSIYRQIRNKFIHGHDPAVFMVIFLSNWGLMRNIHNIIINANRLTKQEFIEYSNLQDTVIYAN